ncbi:MAG: branched-chain amino acid ABC transporter permease LivH [Pseudomonadota bacterium]|nr:branched-chain amino acid ABC transporter permease LivH [Pseudomonadota bacterium]
MAYFLQQLINGLTLGAVYGLIAIGYTMVYGIIGMINFAHGEIYMIGAFVTVISVVVLGLTGLGNAVVGLLVVLLVTMAVTGLYGWAVERVAYRTLRHSTRLAPLISAIGMSVLLQNYVQLLQGARVKTMAPVLQGAFELMRREDGFVVSISYLQIVIVALTMLLMGIVTLVIHRTPLGRAQRACEQDKIMAALVGINVDRTISATFVIGALLAALAGFMVTLYYGVVDFFMGFLAGMKAFTAAVLGGIGSLPGAMLGGIIIGMIESFWAGYVNAQYKDVAVFGILMLVLLVRPNGLFGRPEIEKV